MKEAINTKIFLNQKFWVFTFQLPEEIILFKKRKVDRDGIFSTDVFTTVVATGGRQPVGGGWHLYD